MTEVTLQKTTVVWSGGADSTLALVQLAQLSSETNPVYALSIGGHPNLDKNHRASDPVQTYDLDGGVSGVMQDVGAKS